MNIFLKIQFIICNKKKIKWDYIRQMQNRSILTGDFRLLDPSVYETGWLGSAQCLYCYDNNRYNTIDTMQSVYCMLSSMNYCYA